MSNNNLVLSLFKEKKDGVGNLSSLGSLFRSFRLTKTDLSKLYSSIADKDNRSIEGLLIKKTEQTIKNYFQRVEESDLSLEEKEKYLYDFLYHVNNSGNPNAKATNFNAYVTDSIRTEAGLLQLKSHEDVNSISEDLYGNYIDVIRMLKKQFSRFLTSTSNAEYDNREYDFFVLNENVMPDDRYLMHCEEFSDFLAMFDNPSTDMRKLCVLTNPLHGSKQRVKKTYEYYTRAFNRIPNISFALMDFYKVYARVWFWNEVKAFYEKRYNQDYSPEVNADIINELLMEVFNYKTLIENLSDSKKIATAYQDKKNIPDSHVSKMKDNAFLQKFDHVEIDQDVDLGLLRKVEKDFDKYIKHLNFPSLNKPSFRIRKLGKHKATGIFYPTLNNLVVDGRAIGGHSCSAFTHELGHYLDYNLGQLYDGKQDMLSLTDEYSPVRNKFYSLMQQMDQSSFKRVSDKWYYYVSPVEMFARSFELYMNEKFKKLDYATNFLKPFDTYTTEAVYCYDDELIQLIIEYFDSILGEYLVVSEPEQQPEMKEEKPKVLSNKSALANIGDIDDQMTLFDFI